MKLSTTAAVIAAALAFSVDRTEARLRGRGLDGDFVGNQNGHVNRQPIQRQTNVFYDSEDFLGNQNGHVNRQPFPRQTNFFYDNGDIHRPYSPTRGVRFRAADDDILGDAGPHTPLFMNRPWTFRGDVDEDLLGGQCDHWGNFKKDPKRYGVFLRQRGCPPEGQDVDDDILGDVGGHSPSIKYKGPTFRI